MIRIASAKDMIGLVSYCNKEGWDDMAVVCCIASRQHLTKQDEHNSKYWGSKKESIKKYPKPRTWSYKVISHLYYALYPN